MRTYHNNPLTVSNTKSLKYICGNFTFEALNLHREKSTLEKIVPQGLIQNTETFTALSPTDARSEAHRTPAHNPRKGMLQY